MQDDVAAGEHVPVGGRQAEPVHSDVAGDGRDAPDRHLLELRRPELTAETVEGVIAQDLALDAPRGRRALAVADEQDELAVRRGAQQPLHEGGSDEAGRSGDGDPRAGEGLGDHGHHVYHVSLPNGRQHP